MEKVLNEKITTRWRELFGKNNTNFEEIKLDIESNESNLCVLFKIQTQNKKEFLVNERSKGFKWFFSFLLFTEFRKKRTRNILFMLDEPASNLHSSAQAKILDALEELSKDSLVIYSTHSQYLINPEWLSGAYICINENISSDSLNDNLDDESGAMITTEKYYSFVRKGLSRDKFSYFQPILDRLDYKPSTIEPIPEIIITEGKNDWYTFKYFNEIILKSKPKLNFYPGGGVDKLWDIIRLYLSWGSKFIVILDGDDAGKKAKERYINGFGSIVEDRIFTLNDVLGKKITTEDMIGKSIQKLFCDTAFGENSFDKVKDKKIQLKETLNKAINQLLIQKTTLNTMESKQEFKKLFEFLKSKLKN